MLNYIWVGLIAFSFLFALTADVRDVVQDTYRNGEPLPVVLEFEGVYDPDARRQAVAVTIDSTTYGDFYSTGARPADAYDATLIRTNDGLQLRLDADASLPEPLATIRDVTNSRTEQLQGRLALPASVAPDSVSSAVAATVLFEPVRFVKLNAISQAALDFAEVAASIALSLIGVLALFLGLLKIAEAAGVIQAIGKVVEPLLRPLFPEIPKGHPAFSMIVLNLSANVFGLGNAATPFGIKAMEELQTLNPTEDTATNPMVMLLAMNTASVQLVPPVLLLALMGLQINQLIFAIILATGISLVVAITAAKLFARLPSIRASDPNRLDPNRLDANGPASSTDTPEA
ncbi:MAG: nucleoside recognition domain-containing protein [Bacteroidota bacterium]